VPDAGFTPSQAPARDKGEMTLKPVAEDSPAPVRGKDAPE